MSEEPVWSKIVMAFLEPDDQTSDIIWKVGAALGALFGIIVGFDSAGVGGALVGVVVGSVIGAILLFTVMMIIGRAVLFALVGGAIAVPILIVYSLWGVGK
jgi:hypothetical protein